MTPQWFYFREGKSHGPVTMAEIQRMLKCERLKSTDFVRYFEDSEWMLVSEFLDILSRQRQTMHALKPERDEVSSSESEPGVVSEIAFQGSEIVRDTTSRIADVVSRTWEFVTRLPQLCRSWLTVAALAAIALAYALKDVEWRINVTQRAIDQLMAIEEELDLLQGRDSSVQEWREFQQSARETLVPLQKSLEDLARRSPRLRDHYWTEAGYRQSVARSHLIQACQALRQMVEARGGDDALRANLHRRIDVAHAQSLPAATPPAVESSNWDAFTLGIVMADVLLVLGGAVYWWVRRNQRMQHAP
jgi:hypothetical protein